MQLMVKLAEMTRVGKRGRSMGKTITTHYAMGADTMSIVLASRSGDNLWTGYKWFISLDALARKLLTSGFSTLKGKGLSPQDQKHCVKMICQAFRDAYSDNDHLTLSELDKKYIIGARQDDRATLSLYAHLNKMCKDKKDDFFPRENSDVLPPLVLQIEDEDEEVSEVASVTAFKKSRGIKKRPKMKVRK